MSCLLSSSHSRNSHIPYQPLRPPAQPKVPLSSLKLLSSPQPRAAGRSIVQPTDHCTPKPAGRSAVKSTGHCTLKQATTKCPERSPTLIRLHSGHPFPPWCLRFRKTASHLRDTNHRPRLLIYRPERAPVPKSCPERNYVPELSPERDYVPELSPERDYVPELSPERAPVPKSSRERDSAPTSCPERAPAPTSRPERAPVPESSPERAPVT
ncbi:Filamentous hemagglutinin [Labeo rohita]|uniref:Filamentous hemagglutinin n=1 Tax=Labeo rohita TaxID=84645 RepID=A0ABQ8LME9_LABRO|nr:Filamentous hemagglutinin [Labeo rohita]